MDVGILRKARAMTQMTPCSLLLNEIGSVGLYCYISKISSHLCDSSRRSLENSGLILSSLVRSQSPGLVLSLWSRSSRVSLSGYHMMAGEVLKAGLMLGIKQGSQSQSGVQNELSPGEQNSRTNAGLTLAQIHRCLQRACEPEYV